MISKIRNFLRQPRVPRTAPAETNPFLKFAPAGHFYSPIPDYNLITSQTDRPLPKSVADVALNEGEQLKWLQTIARYYAELPYQKDDSRLRYSFNQTFYCQADAIYLHGFLRHFKPHKIIEVGSGHSSALILDTNEMFLERKMDCTFIEPYPDRLLSLLRPEEKEAIHLIKSGVQSVPVDVFTSLAANDILFIDSSHVSKYGSDVNYLIFEVLPVLKPGVLVHIHDIFYPFEYPRQWLKEGRAWNEAYVVHAFLQNNSEWEILLFADLAGRKFRSFLEQNMPLCLQNTGGALWIRKHQN